MLKNLLLLTGFSTFVVIVIVGLDVYHKITVSSLAPSTQRRIEPISPNFDKETLNKLKERVPINVDLTQKSTVISEDSRDTTAVPTPASSEDGETSIASGEAIIESPVQP